MEKYMELLAFVAEIDPATVDGLIQVSNATEQILNQALGNMKQQIITATENNDFNSIQKLSEGCRGLVSLQYEYYEFIGKYINSIKTSGADNNCSEPAQPQQIVSNVIPAEMPELSPIKTAIEEKCVENNTEVNNTEMQQQPEIQSPAVIQPQAESQTSVEIQSDVEAQAPVESQPQAQNEQHTPSVVVPQEQAEVAEIAEQNTQAEVAEQPQEKTPETPVKALSKEDGAIAAALAEAEAEAKAENEKNIPLIQDFVEEPKIVDVYKAKIGDEVVFGNYPMTASGDISPIRWIVVEKSSNSLLLLSTFALDCMQFNFEDVDMTWEKATIRTWLNSEFYNKAFTKLEQSRIKPNMVINEEEELFYDEDTYQIEGGNDTFDKIYLMSRKEYISLSKTFPKVAEMVVTAYANGKSGIDDNWYWLRSMGVAQNRPVYVNKDGLQVTGNDITSGQGCIRPMMRIIIR